MKKTIYTFLLVFSSFCGLSQVPLDRVRYADSLIQSLKKPLSSPIKARASFLLSELYLRTDTTKARQYLKEGKAYSKGNRFMEAVYLYYQALEKLYSDPAFAENIFLQADAALNKFKTKEALRFRSMCWHNYAFSQHLRSHTKTAIEIVLNKAVPLSLQSGDTAFLGKNYFLLSAGFKNLGQHAKEKIYLEKAISTLKKADAPQYLAMIYHSMAENYISSGDLKEAKSSLDRMMSLLKPYPKSEMWLEYYAGEALRLNTALRYDGALEIIEKGVALAKKIKGTYAEKRLLLQKFYALDSKKEHIKARDVAIALAGDQQFMTWETNRLQIYSGLATSYEGMHDLQQAYKWLKLYSKLNDSLSNSKLKETATLLEVKYRTAENQKKILALNSENEKTKLAAKNSRLLSWLLGLSSVLLFVTGIFTWLFLRNSKKLALQKDLSHQQELIAIDRQQQIKLVQVMLNAKEDEQNRLARDLHDGLGGMLTVIKLNLADYIQERYHRSNPELQSIVSQLEVSIRELRRVSHNMMPEMLLRLGLKASLSDLCESVASTALNVDFQHYGIKNDLPAQEQINIYRIAQEAISNATRHAQAQNLLLQCAQDNDVFFITVEDDGQGFDASHLDRVAGIGLSNIRSRVEYLKGKIEILSENNKRGTSINIELHVTA